MTSSYETIYSRFLQKISDFEMVQFEENVVYASMNGWLRSVISKPYVRKLFESIAIDDEIMKINYELKNTVDDFTDEYFVIEILSLGMVVEWLEPQVKNILYTKQFVGGKEEKFYAQSNQLAQLQSLLSDAKTELRKIIRDHGYINNSYIGGGL